MNVLITFILKPVAYCTIALAFIGMALAFIALLPLNAWIEYEAKHRKDDLSTLAE